MSGVGGARAEGSCNFGAGTLKMLKVHTHTHTQSQRNPFSHLKGWGLVCALLKLIIHKVYKNRNLLLFKIFVLSCFRLQQACLPQI